MIQPRDDGVRAGGLNDYMFVLPLVVLFQLVRVWLAFFKDVFHISQSSWLAPAGVFAIVMVVENPKKLPKQ